MNKHFAIYKISTTTGCVFEDGSDTREDSSEFVLVSQSDEEDFNETMASAYGDQDYSFQVDFTLVCDLWAEDLDDMKKLFGILIENDKHFKEIDFNGKKVTVKKEVAK